MNKNVMTMARYQPSLKILGIELGYYNGKEIYPRTICTWDVGLYLYTNHFCLIWKSQSVSFKHAIQEIKTNFEMVDNFLKEENVNSQFKYDIILKKSDYFYSIRSWNS